MSSSRHHPITLTAVLTTAPHFGCAPFQHQVARTFRSEVPQMRDKEFFITKMVPRNTPRPVEEASTSPAVMSRTINWYQLCHGRCQRRLIRVSANSIDLQRNSKYLPIKQISTAREIASRLALMLQRQGRGILSRTTHSDAGQSGLGLCTSISATQQS